MKTMTISPALMFITFVVAPVYAPVYTPELQKTELDSAELANKALNELSHVHKTYLSSDKTPIVSVEELTNRTKEMANTAKKVEIFVKDLQSNLSRPGSKNAINPLEFIHAKTTIFKEFITEFITYIQKYYANGSEDTIKKLSKEIQMYADNIVKSISNIAKDTNNIQINDLITLDNNGKFLAGVFINFNSPESTIVESTIVKILNNIKKDLRAFSAAYYDYFDKMYKKQNRTFGQKVKNFFTPKK